MAGIGFILGGALKGLGDGLAAQTKMNIEERREAASRAARLQELQVSSDLAGGREAARDQRTAAADMAKQDDSQAFTAEQNSAASRAQRERDAAEREFKREQGETEQKYKERTLRLDSALSTNKQITVEREQARLRGFEPFDTKVDGETGAISVIYKNGKGEILNGVIARPKPDKADADLTSVGDYGAKGPGAAKPAAPDYVWDPKANGGKGGIVANKAR